MRRHVQRDLTRIGVLATCDLIAGLVVAEIMQRAWSGGWLAGTQNVVGLGALGVVIRPELALALVLGFVVTGSYGPGDRRRDYARLFAGCALATAVVFWSGIWSGPLGLVVGEGLVTSVVAWVGVSLERFVMDGVVGRIRGKEHNRARTLFVGPAGSAQHAMSSSVFAGGGEYRPVGFVDVDEPRSPQALGHVSSFSKYLGEAGAEVVVVCGSVSDHDFQEVVDSGLAAGCQVLSFPRTAQVAGLEPSLFWRDGLALVQLTAPSLRGQQLFVKRILDVAGAVLGLVLLSPLLAVLALVIRLDSAGPVLFRQERVGRGGRRFRIVKFRTMVTGAEAQRGELLGLSMYADQRLFKLKRDPRITRAGGWLRRLSLDELPQLLNVLRGEMSLVGPRPPLPSEVELYERHHYARFDVKPGITGPWQVSGRNNVLDFESVVRIETEYIRNWTLLKDLAILLRTVPAVLGMDGAH